MELYDVNGNLVGDFPPQAVSCQTDECLNKDAIIEVPNHPSVTIQCGVCGQWILHPEIPNTQE